MKDRYKGMRILVIRTDRIGDLIVSTPVFKTLKETYPSSYIAAMVSPYTKDLLTLNPDVDEIILFDEKGSHSGFSGLMDLVRTVRSKNFDAAVALFSNFRVGLMTILAGIPLRIAPATKVAQVFYNRRVLQRRSKAEKHEADYNLDLLKTLDIKKFRREIVLPVDEASRAEARKFINAEGLEDACTGGKLVGIHPGSGDSAKNWRPERYAELADRLIADHGISVLLTGGANERDLLLKVAGLMKGSPSLYLSRNLRSFAALLAELTVFVSASTGPMHMAAALKIPTVSLFCPIRVCSPVRWGPIGNNSRVLMPDVPQCERCTAERCRYYNCMDLITVESAAEAVRDLAEGN